MDNGRKGLEVMMMMMTALLIQQHDRCN